MKIKIWASTGSQASEKSVVVDVEKDLGFSDEEWTKLDISSKIEVIEGYVSDHDMVQWGFDEQV